MHATHLSETRRTRPLGAWITTAPSDQSKSFMGCCSLVRLESHPLSQPLKRKVPLARVGRCWTCKSAIMLLWHSRSEDFYSTSGIGVANLGHCHPVVTKAAQKQCGEIVRRDHPQHCTFADSITCATQVHAQVNIGFSKPYLELVNALLPVMPRAASDTSQDQRASMLRRPFVQIHRWILSSSGILELKR